MITDNSYSNSIIASYATFKELYKSKKYTSPYQILAEFAKYIIDSHSLYSFTSIEIQEKLNHEFGFNPPVAVLRTALKKIPEVQLDKGVFTVDREKLNRDANFQSYKVSARNNCNVLIDSLSSFVKEKHPDFRCNKKELEQWLISFLLDEDEALQHHAIIGEFILYKEGDPAIDKILSEIREGSILYSGLSYNISEYGTLKNHLTLFLDTEILFDLAGLNGTLFQKLANDFLALVKEANRNERKITLKFFPVVKEDVDNFFSRAERIVSGKGEPVLKTAMKSIVTGCKDVSDVKDKQSDFYRFLSKNNGITVDEKDNYYSKEDTPFELEGVKLTDYPSSERANYEGLRYCSNINKLRKGIQTNDLLNSKYLFVTDTRKIIEISRELTNYSKTEADQMRGCDYAVSLSFITNLLWFKLNRGFGSQDFPNNLDATVKARVILSGYITQEIFSSYSELKQEYAEGLLSEEQAANRIIGLRQKVGTPEELNSENIDEKLAFTNDYFNQVSESIANNKKLVREKEKEITILAESKSSLQAQLDNEREINSKQQKEIDSLQEQLTSIKEKEATEKEVKEKRKRIIINIARIVGKIVAAIAIGFLVWFICQHWKKDFATWLSIVVSVVSLVPTGLRKDFISLKSDIERDKMSHENDERLSKTGS